MRAEDLAGGWVDDDGNTLVIDTEDGTYGYRTYYGRVGRGTIPRTLASPCWTMTTSTMTSCP